LRAARLQNHQQTFCRAFSGDEAGHALTHENIGSQFYKVYLS
jgi:hypothetical protein